MKALLIAEKPDLMRKVKEAYDKNGFKDTIIFMAFHGHIMELLAPNEYKEEWKSWSLETLPIIPDKFIYKPTQNDLEFYKKLKQIIKDGGFDYLINCCDPDREGQLIFYSFYENIKCDLPVKRMWHADLTEKELIRALNNMEDDLNTPRLANMKEASKLRAELDWLVGMNASRIVSLKRNSLTRVGRVVTPTFKFLVDREKEIRDFKPVTTYGVDSIYKEGFTGEYSFLNSENKLIEHRFKTKENAEDFINKLSNTKNGIVEEIIENITSEKAPKLPSIADLQMAANKQFGFTLDRTLAIVQSLYEKKLVSYPRTDCCYVTSAIAKDFELILASLKSLNNLGNIISSISKDSITRLQNDKNYVNDAKVTAHYAIIPTISDFSNLNISKEENMILELIAKRFISIFLDKYECKKVKVIVDVNGEKFVSHGSQVQNLGFKEILGNEQKDKELPNLKKGQSLNIEEFSIGEYISQPPARYTDATLLNAMINAGNFIEDEDLANVLKGNEKVKDSGGIGTPATRAAIVNKILQPIKNRDGSSYNLATRKGKSFVVSDEGMELMESIEKFSISSPELTAIWEEKLRGIESGNLSKKDFTNEMINYIKELTLELTNGQYHAIHSRQNSRTTIEEIVCPYCGGQIIDTGKFYICSNYSKDEAGCKFVLKHEVNHAKITKDDIIDLVSKGKTKALNMKSDNTGNKYKASIVLNKEERKLSFEFAKDEVKPSGLKCPVCGSDLFKRKGKFGDYYSCDNKDFNLSDKVCGHKLIAAEIKKLLKGEEIGPIDNLTSKSGKNFTAKLKLSNENKIEFVFPKK